jgi:hypothetical protein
MMSYAKLIGCGCIALLALGCGSKGDGEDDDDDDTGGSSTGGSSTGGSSTGGSGGSGGALPVMTTMSFSDASEICPVGSGNTVTDCWKFVDSNADMAVSTPVPADEIEFGHNPDDGYPEADGAFEATIPYSEPSQWVSFGINFASQDLTSRIIKARVKIASGLGDPTELMTAPAGTKVYAKSGMGYCYANGAYFNQGDMGHDVGTWQEIQFNLLRTPDYEDPNCAEPFDPSDVREIGIQFDSNSMSTTATTAVVLIDNVTY